MVTFVSPLARKLEVAIYPGRGFPIFLEPEDIVSGMTVTWGRRQLHEPPRKRTLAMSIRVGDDIHALREYTRIVRGKIIVTMKIPSPTSPRKKDEKVPVFSGFIDQLHGELNGDQTRVHIRAIEGTDFEADLRLTVSKFPVNRSSLKAMQMVKEFLRERNSKFVYSASPGPEAELYDAKFTQKKLRVGEWLAAGVCTPMGTWPSWRADYSFVTPTIWRPDGITHGGLTRLTADNVIASKLFEVGHQHRARVAQIWRSGSVVGDQGVIVVTINDDIRHGPKVVVTSDYGVYQRETKEKITALWALQRTAPRTFTFSDRLIAPSWWENRHCWIPMERGDTGVHISDDPVASLIARDPTFSPIGGTLRFTPQETTHTINAIWRTPPT